MSVLPVDRLLALTLPRARRLVSLRSAVGERGKWSGGAERRAWRIAVGAKRPAAEPETEARRPCGTLRMPARDERTVCEVERAWLRGGQGRPAARGTEQNRALVTAGTPVTDVV